MRRVLSEILNTLVALGLTLGVFAVNGAMALPDQPGLGLELRDDTLEKYGVKLG